MRAFLRAGILGAAVAAAASGQAGAAEPVTLTIKDHQFTPREVTMPAGERFRIEVRNEDVTPAEFESSAMRIEKVIVPGGKIVVSAGPLKPGTYEFFDEYHPDTARGILTAVERTAGR